MNPKVVRMIIPQDLYRRYKALCAMLDLSVPKQTAELIKKFVEIQEENEKRIKGE